jgi:ATP-dependent RNA helicase A
MPVILNIGKLAHFEPSQRQNAVGVVPWSPPQSNWNPWTSSNIDEGPLAYVSAIWVLRSVLYFPLHLSLGQS